MGYCNDPAMVRVDFFKESGKWYTTEAVRWIGYDGYIIDEFCQSLCTHLRQDNGTYRLSEMVAVCLDPYSKTAHPLSIRMEDAIRIGGTLAVGGVVDCDPHVVGSGNA